MLLLTLQVQCHDHHKHKLVLEEHLEAVSNLTLVIVMQLCFPWTQASSCVTCADTTPSLAFSLIDATVHAYIPKLAHEKCKTP